MGTEPELELGRTGPGKTSMPRALRKTAESVPQGPTVIERRAGAGAWPQVAVPVLVSRTV